MTLMASRFKTKLIEAWSATRSSDMQINMDTFWSHVQVRSEVKQVLSTGEYLSILVKTNKIAYLNVMRK